MAERAFDRYLENEVLAQSPARRVVFLYAQLLANMRRATGALVSGQVELRSDCLLKAQGIVQELLAALDLGAAPLAEQLAAIYRHLWRELVAVNRNPDAARLAILISQVASLHEAWEAAAQSLDDRGAPLDMAR